MTALAIALLATPLTGETPSHARAGLEVRPFVERTFRAPVGTLFETLDPAATGVHFVNPIDNGHPMKYLYASSMSTGGVAVGDFDGDGRPDLYLASGPGRNALFRQVAAWEFEDVTAAAGVDGGDRWGVGCTAFDADGDGDLDLYVCNYLSPNQLFLNRGDGTFEEAAEAAGIAFVDASHTPAVCDFDGDGDLDLYIMTNRWYRPEGFPEEETLEIGPDGRPRVRDEWIRHYDAVQTGPDRIETQVVGRPDILCRNNGDGTFTVVTEEAGIDHRGHGLAAIWFDWTGDGRPDLWVGNDFDDADHLYRNNGDGTFTDVTLGTVPYTTWFSMGADFGDVNGDGLDDFFIADMSGTTHFKQKTAMGAMGAKYWFMENAEPPQLMRNCLFLNAGNGRFLEGAWLAGLANSNWTWAVRLADLDCDGWSDVYIQAGMSRNFNEKDDPSVRVREAGKTQWDRFEKLPPLREPNWAYRNTGDLRFEDVSAAWGLDHVGMSYGAAVADLDGDGDLDIVSVRLDEPVALIRNNGTAGHRAVVQLRADAGNRFGVGARVALTAGGRRQVATLTTMRGYLGSHEPVAHFGLGETAVIDRLEIRWPDGHVQAFENPPADHLLTVHRSAATAGDPTREEQDEKPVPLFRPADILAAARHEEADFPEEFEREPLLPNKMSRWGPGHAWEDVDGDGVPDLWLGGGRHGERGLFLNKGGTFTRKGGDDFADATLHEDLGALFFDADGDGDLDLYVVSGGVEVAAGSPLLSDRLYLNDGSGRFSKAPAGTLPDATISGGPVAAADFDRDGDLDLFVGGRCRPGEYPLAPPSRLLRNEGNGGFVDITPELAPAVAEAGMVTGALWSDVDGDGWLDLLATCEWGPIRLFRNVGGRLEEVTEEAGLAERTGWWNGIAGRDLDGDGDIDYVVTNFGLNTKYHASADHPALLYYGDMDGSGVPHLVEAEFEDGKLFPVRGRSCSSSAMPFIAEKFATYREFALATLDEIYTPGKLREVTEFRATELRAGILRNDGSGRFSFEPLPWLAQIAPSLGVVISEIDGDGIPDLVVGQNFFHPQVETGRMSGGLGALLLGTGNAGEAEATDADPGAFEPLWPDASGISIPEDARGVSLVDLDGDGFEDLAVAVNDGPMLSFLRNAPDVDPLMRIRLEGPPGNPSAAGARVVLRQPGRPLQAAEIHAGSGYLSQGPAELTFAAGDPGAGDRATLEVRWPDGRTTRSIISSGPGRLVLPHP